MDNSYFGQIIACTNDRFQRTPDHNSGQQMTITCGFTDTPAYNHPNSPTKSVAHAPNLID
ncbi:hypothetical protein [Mobiluncus curtisii]|uniref:hypothetical protein n=1 Tax=Mobiluncus curtisii TaxID=2051 RepID=UPI0014703665|nr:hypothetical protein [Mobiluncus curtisii]NMW45461.1 hypothetical protein [Mobiluncus curtisii]